MQRCNKVRFLYKYSVPEENSVFGEVSHWEEEGGGVGAYSRSGAFSNKYGNYFFYFTAECHQLWNLW